MLRSMTGYGTAEARDEDGGLRVDIRSLNHKYREVVTRLPEEMPGLEANIRSVVTEYVWRGRVEVLVAATGFDISERSVVVDKTLARSVHNALVEMSEMLGLEREVRLDSICAVPGVLREQQVPCDTSRIWQLLEPALHEALDSMVEMRMREGEELQKDLLARIECVEELNGRIRSLEGSMLETHREHLHARVRRLLGESVEVSEDRLLQEVVLFTERSSIHEEQVRVAGHVSQFRHTVDKGGGPVGKKLDFILQEIAREADTTGAKAATSEIGNAAVEMKTEVAKAREQVQNIE